MAKETYIVTNVSAGVINDKESGKPITWAKVECLNNHVTNNGRDGNVSYGSPRVSLNLIDRDTGLPNIELARKLQAANCYLQPVEFEGSIQVVKQKGEEKMSFVIFDALLSVKPVQKAG